MRWYKFATMSDEDIDRFLAGIPDPKKKVEEKPLHFPIKGVPQRSKEELMERMRGKLFPPVKPQGADRAGDTEEMDDPALYMAAEYPQTTPVTPQQTSWSPKKQEGPGVEQEGPEVEQKGLSERQRRKLRQLKRFLRRKKAQTENYSQVKT
jgi:hypothetical protein